MDSLRDAFEAVESRQKTLEVYADDEEALAELERQFSTRNVRVIGRPAPSSDDPGFVVVRAADGEFLGALSVEHLDAIVSPEIHPPWVIAETDVDHAAIFDFLDNTVFTSYDRRQLRVVAREIEERAWRVGSGTLLVGFQTATAFRAQEPVYERFVRETDVTVTIFIDDEWSGGSAGGAHVVSAHGVDGEIGRFWFVLFDGGGRDLDACGLLAEEREPDQYYGFWTDDPDRVDEVIAYLETTYGGG